MGPDWSRASGLFLLQQDEWSTGRQEKQEKKLLIFESVFKILEKCFLSVFENCPKNSGQCIVKQEVPGSSSASIHSRLVGADIGTFVSQRTKPG